MDEKDEIMDQAIYGSMNISMEYYLIALLLMLATGFVCFYRKRDILVSVSWGLLVGYIFLIFASTVITRTVKADYDFEWRPFWSYVAIKEGKEYLLSLNSANVLMLMPVGFLVSCIRDMDCKKAVLVGVLVSSVIEISQLVLKRGLFEFDDIFHNTVGCVVGYLIYKLLECSREKMGVKEKGDTPKGN